MLEAGRVVKIGAAIAGARRLDVEKERPDMGDDREGLEQQKPERRGNKDTTRPMAWECGAIPPSARASSEATFSFERRADLTTRFFLGQQRQSKKRGGSAPPWQTILRKG